MMAQGYGGAPMAGPPPGGYGGAPGGGYGGAPGGYGGAPGGYGGGPPQYGGPGGGMPGAGGDVNTTLPLILGIVSIFCCWPAAIVVIVFSLQAKKLKDQGQVDAARSKAKTASLIAYIVIALGLVLDIVAVVLNVLAHH
jgi:hypothetical protein